jgi:hypothetical protein
MGLAPQRCAEYVRSYEFQVPIFVLTHQPPSQQPLHDDRLTFTFISDGVESAVSVLSTNSCALDWSTRCVSISCPCCSATASACLAAAISRSFSTKARPQTLRGNRLWPRLELAGIGMRVVATGEPRADFLAR